MSRVAKLRSATLTTTQDQTFILNTPYNRIQITWVGVANLENADTITITGIDEDGSEIRLTDVNGVSTTGVYTAGPLQMAMFDVQLPKIKVLFTEDAGTDASIRIMCKTYCTSPVPDPSWRAYTEATADPQEVKTDYI